MVEIESQCLQESEHLVFISWGNQCLNQETAICATKCLFHDITVHSLDHTSEEFVDFLFSVTEVSTLNVVVCLLAPSTGRCVQLEFRKKNR